MCVFHCIFSIFIKNIFAVINCTWLKSTFGSMRNYWLQGDAFVVRGLAQACDKTCYSGRYVVLILEVKRNGKQFYNRDRYI
jgi:hypothetical protein